MEHLRLANEGSYSLCAVGDSSRNLDVTFNQQKHDNRSSLPVDSKLLEVNLEENVGDAWWNVSNPHELPSWLQVQRLKARN